jgi:hypothetical protein
VAIKSTREITGPTGQKVRKWDPTSTTDGAEISKGKELYDDSGVQD